ncbi:MAG: ABC transporter permease [bacterium]
MNISVFIANKYVKNKQDSKFLSLVSVISIFGIGLGVAVVIMALSILEGFDHVVREKIVKLNSHIQVTTFGRKNVSFNPDLISFTNKELNGNVSSMAPYLSKEAIIKSKALSEGIFIYGIDPIFDNSDIKSFIVSGKYRFSDSNGNPALIMGKKLAEKLFVQVGDKVTIFTLRMDSPPSETNPPAIQQFVVSGIYQSGMAEYDDINCYANIKDVNEFLGFNNKVTGYNLRLNNIAGLDSIEAKLQNSLGYPYYVRSIYKVHQNIFTWLELQKEPVPIVLGLIIIVAVFNIVGTLLMIVLEKTGAIGILKSLGATRKQIINIFLVQGFYLGLYGLMFGNLFALILSLIQKYFEVIALPSSIYFVSSVPISINPIHYLTVSLITMAMCLTTAILPSYIASRITPISAIRFE